MIAPATMSTVNAAWLAGLLDGEGCIDAPRSYPRIRIKMADHDVVLRAAALMDGTVYPEVVPGRKPLLVAAARGTKAVAVLRAILPFLGARRTAKATEIILGHERLYVPGAAPLELVA